MLKKNFQNKLEHAWQGMPAPGYGTLTVQAHELQINYNNHLKRIKSCSKLLIPCPTLRSAAVASERALAKSEISLSTVH